MFCSIQPPALQSPAGKSSNVPEMTKKKEQKSETNAAKFRETHPLKKETEVTKRC
jgi:hypothetical protein